MAHAVHFNTIGSTFQMNSAAVSRFMLFHQEDKRDVLLHLAQEDQHLRFLPVCAGVFGHNKVKQLRAESNGELLGSHNYV